MIKKHFIKTNEEIYILASQLQNTFIELNNHETIMVYPAYIGFCISYNFSILLKYAQMIDSARLGVGKKYGILHQSENGSSYDIPKDKQKIVEKEIQDLLNMQQEIEIYMLSYEEIKEFQFSLAQMQALIFMIEEPINE